VRYESCALRVLCSTSPVRYETNEMSEPRHLTTEELHAGLDDIRRSPRDNGALVLIVRRPGINEREALQDGELDVVHGLVGDSWSRRGSSRSVDGGPHPEMQLNIMNARAVALVAQSPDRWQLAGDQLFVDLDLSPANLPAGTRLAIGSAIVEVTAEPHTGCGKFVSRFGLDAMKFVNSPIGRELSLRGINAKVVQPGAIRVGDSVRKM
jgi:MOSC domain-containing protein